MNPLKKPAAAEPIRLFRSNFLEFFTHISPITVLALWTPVVVYFLIFGSQEARIVGTVLGLPLYFLLGLFFWTLVEYLLHRFFFHFKPRGPWQEKISFLFHGIHHIQPEVKTRLVMPAVVSVPLAVLVYSSIWSISFLFGTMHAVKLIFAGAVLGYLVYDMMHYACHHLPMKLKWLQWLKKHHLLHHYKTPEARFGVSSPLWDYVFGTVRGKEDSILKE